MGELHLENTGFSITLGDIIESTEEQRKEWVDKLTSFVKAEGLLVGEQQVNSWEDCFEFMHNNLTIDIDRNIPALFEYKLPFTSGMRTDVILLLDRKVVVLEFKRTKGIKNKYGTQVINYCDHLYRYHDVTAREEYDVEGAIVWTSGEAYLPGKVFGIPVLTHTNFTDAIKKMIGGRPPIPKCEEWCAAKFTILPSMLEAASNLLFNGELPMIKTIKESDIASCNGKVEELIAKAETGNKKIAIVVSGVPGAGKTLVALNTIFKCNKDGFKSIYVTGNDSLIYALRAEFNQAVSKIEEPEIADKAKAASKYVNRVVEYKTYKDIDTYIVAFDEGQRLWDENRMDGGQNELEYLIARLDEVYKANKKAVLLCMYGDGQVIGHGEEAGLALWQKAIKAHPDWEFYFPNNIAKELGEGIDVNIEPKLRLDESIRNDFINIDGWISTILSKTIDSKKIKDELEKLMNRGFQIYITRDFETIMKAMPRCKTKDSIMQYGLMASSNASGYNDVFFKNYTGGRVESSYFKGEDTGKWYINKAEDLDWVATEYACQGLEIAWPVVMFGKDLFMKNGTWTVDKTTTAFGVIKDGNKRFEKPARIIGNVYRVLLTRSRTGMVLFLPKNEPILNELYDFFIALGIETLCEDTFEKD